ncbi:5-(carboxyamino)imidazole ribonucleotide mutase [Nannocystis pusilla]|uniref:5-(carboxyamino)imidazole ribonucleotide mutase n=1 Tax=Nannocystis pusilla TaxID=889268 RepID=UPI003207D489
MSAGPDGTDTTGEQASPPAGTNPLVGVIMGSRSDWETMREAAAVLRQFGVPHECRVVSAHRTPEWLAEYARTAETRGIEVIVAGAGGAAHLPGMVAAETRLPVFGVPVQTSALGGLDSLLSIVQMPRGVPVGTLAIGPAGAYNAALQAIRVLALARPALARALREFRDKRAEDVRGEVLPDA